MKSPSATLAMLRAALRASCAPVVLAMLAGCVATAGAQDPSHDAGSRRADAGPRWWRAAPRDAGPRDGGPFDAGPLDAGPLPDAAAAPEHPDAGASEDAGPPVPVAHAEPPDEHGGGHAEVGSDQAQVIRTLLGLVALLALAWIGGHPRVQKLEERLGISQMVTSGLPFVALGVIARARGVEILNEEVLTALIPLLHFGLGWIGFHTGFNFEAASMEEVPRGTSSLVILLTGVSFVAIAVTGAVLLLGFGFDAGTSSTAVLRDAAILGLAGALSAPTLERVAGSRIPGRALELARTIGVLDDVVAVIALALLFAWLHPGHGAWNNLPGVGWLFVTFGMAATLGLVMYGVLRSTDSAAESTALLLGSVCFTAGMAGYFSLPPLVVCFLAGILLKNMPGGDKPRLAAAFASLERPIYLVFLVVVGALWQVGDWRGWVLLPLFVVARVCGRWMGLRMARRLPAESRHPGLDDLVDADLITPPMGTLALAFVVTAQTLYESDAIQAIVTAVIGGAVATEILVQIVARVGRTSTPPPRAPSRPPPSDEAEDDTEDNTSEPHEADEDDRRGNGSEGVEEPPPSEPPPPGDDEPEPDRARHERDETSSG